MSHLAQSGKVIKRLPFPVQSMTTHWESKNPGWDSQIKLVQLRVADIFERLWGFASPVPCPQRGDWEPIVAHMLLQSQVGD